jgi:EAL domain-containing protein (putative c-di-GMP-specific phosphodiesterase class I)
LALISTIIRLGQTMHLETVAEGIERAEEMLVLRRQGCNTGQGFHFSPPVAPEELTDLLTAQSRLPAVLPTQHRALAQRLP